MSIYEVWRLKRRSQLLIRTLLSLYRDELPVKSWRASEHELVNSLQKVLDTRHSARPQPPQQIVVND